MTSPTQRTLAELRKRGYTAEVTERWVPIEGYRGSYEVSDRGRVRSLDRMDAAGARRRGKLLSIARDSDGYPVASLGRNGKMRQFKVHRLVATAFVPNVLGAPEVNHLDGDKSNATPANLEWVTTKANHEHAALIGLKARGERSGRASLTRDVVLEIRARRSRGETATAIACALRIGLSATEHVIYRRVWRHL